MKIPALNLSAIGVIPARYSSTRFPGKPLIIINGISMLERVYRQVQEATSLSAILIATDDERIIRHASGFGANVILTDSSHCSGTDRIAEAIQKQNKKYDVVVNIQGDEPFIDPAQIDSLVQCFYDKHVAIATLIKKIKDCKEWNSPHVVKAVVAKNGNALYFSRSPIPYVRNTSQDHFIQENNVYKHIGMYAYRADILPELSRLQPTALESAESLEQLRWLENGFTIRTLETSLETLSIDTPEDLVKAELYLAGRNL